MTCRCVLIQVHALHSTITVGFSQAYRAWSSWAVFCTFMNRNIQKIGGRGRKGRIEHKTPVDIDLSYESIVDGRQMCLYVYFGGLDASL